MGKLKEYYHEEIRKANQERNNEATLHEKETYNVNKPPLVNVTLLKSVTVK